MGPLTATTTTTTIVADPTRGVKVDASLVAEPFRQEVRARVERLKVQGLGMYILHDICWCGVGGEENC